MRSPIPVPRQAAAASFAPLVITLLCAGCSGGGGGGGTPPARADAVQDSLQRLGVDTTTTARETAPGVAAPSGYSPLGQKPVLSHTDELMLLGMGLSSPAMSNPAIVLEMTGANGAATSDVLHAENAGAMPWVAETGLQNSPRTLRAAVAIDLDGNGLQETAIVHHSGIETRIFVIDDETHGFVSRDLLVANASDVTNVAAVAADLDGDGRDELVVGLTENGQGTLQAFRYDGQTFAPIGPKRSYAPRIQNSTLYLSLAAGNLDNDRADEIAVAINEVNADDGQPRLAVYDDLQAGFTVLHEADFTGRDEQNLLRVGVSVSVAIGDVDGDNTGEVLLGGVTAFTRNCNSTPYFLLALDDALHGFAAVAGHYFTWHYSGCGSGDDPRIRTVFLHTLDLDGDGRQEVVANQFVFDDFATATPWTEVTDWRLPDAAVWSHNGYGMFDVNTASFVVGDFTGDDRDDIACYRQDLAYVDVYSLAATATTIARVRHVQVPFSNSQTPHNPLLLPVDVDTDGIVLSYSEAEYQLVFSEPIVLAALAAAPSKDNAGQNTQACYTAFGNTSTTIQERERSVTFSAGVSVGVNITGGVLTQSGFEMKAKATVAATRTVGSAYELSKTIVFSSAPKEDTVVFTSVPIDRYTYTVLSHPDPAMVGQKVVVNLPRSPITLQAERGFYNRTVPEGSVRVDERIFAHVIGKPSSYPTAAQKNGLLAQHGGLQIGPQSVGQGGGSTEVTLQVGESISHGGALAVGFEMEVEATAGAVLAGVSVGVESTNTWRITSGQSTTYTGVVGALDAAHFASDRYSFGLFTYVFRDPATTQQFQVLDYWVE